MATRSTISVEHLDGKISSVYCHWDGYVNHNGRLLVEHYNSLELAEKLVSGGSISSLGERISPIDNSHNFNNPENGTTIYYHRDRNEDLVINKFWNIKYFLVSYDYQDYNYLFAQDANGNYEWKYVRNKLKNFNSVKSIFEGILI